MQSWSMTEGLKLVVIFVMILGTCITDPQCNGPGKYDAAQPNQYYDCVNFLFWWCPKLRTCPTDEIFSVVLQDCTVLTTTTTVTTEVTTVVTTPVPEPVCNGPGRYPAPQPNQYYECVNSWIFWWTLQLNTCPSGQLYDAVTQICYDSITTTSSPTTTECITTTQLPESTTSFSEPQCNGPGKYPAPQSNQYYECVNSWIFWWALQLNTCPTGQVYNADLQDCNFLTTTTTTTTVCITTTTVPAETTTVFQEPVCYGPGKYPGPQPSQYYECINSWIFWWYAQLNDCPSGEIFSIEKQSCA